MGASVIDGIIAAAASAYNNPDGARPRTAYISPPNVARQGATDMLYFDPFYFIFIAPAVLLALWAQLRVKSAYAEAGQHRTLLTGAEAARKILDANGLQDVNIEPTTGILSDHYDPRTEVLRLSEDVYHGQTLAALGIAAHESGHALQKSAGYAPLKLRSGLVPLAATGGQLSMLFITAGFLLMYMVGRVGFYALYAGIILFSLTVIFQIVNLPVEYDASRRAKLVLVQQGLVPPGDMGPVNRVLSAAALTYVAATLTAILQLLYILWRAGLLGGRRSD